MKLAEARHGLLSFIEYNKLDYSANWHHALICDKIDAFLASETANRLMLFVPPQHGKSEITSRFMPAYALGRNPDIKIAACSYSIDLARSFNRDVQRIMDGKNYQDVFPYTALNSKRITADSRGSWIRNTEEFEVVGRKGSYKAVGVMGGLSGRAVDLAIIDDPVKDALEANSETYRNRVWEWYVNVLETRLHNNSKVVLIMTRWHEDDLAGRLLVMQPEKWEVIKIPAILESDPIKGDPRKYGEALWPEKHSVEKLTSLRKLSETTFQSLYQQNPTTPGGNKIKSEWFRYCDPSDLPLNLVWDLWVDGAYTNKTENDPTGLAAMAYDKRSGCLFVRHAESDHLEMPELLDRVPKYCAEHSIGRRSRVLIEPKASGKSLRQMLRSTAPQLSPVEIKSHLVSEGKEARLQTASPRVESGRVVLVRGAWTDAFVHQITAFPNAPHDEYVDLLGYACDYYFPVEGRGLRRVN